MTPTDHPPGTATVPGHSCQVFAAEDIYVIHGVNAGDPLDGPENLCEGDIYALFNTAKPLKLVLAHGDGGERVTKGSEIGRPGDKMTLVARYTLMASDATTLDLLFMRLDCGAALALPLSPMSADLDYTLVAIDDTPEPVPLADLVCVSFARGTMIALADGRLRPIETLQPGDRVLTRDHGPQPVRWLGKATLRAVGSFAPVTITAGTLGNAGDLIVSPHHRIFLYHRNRRAEMETAEILIQAKLLVDDDKIFQREGGYVDYFSIVFDHHEIIYAEGVPAESLMVNDATIRHLPAELATELKARFPGLAQSQHFGTEASRQLLDHLGRDELLGRPKRKDS